MLMTLYCILQIYCETTQISVNILHNWCRLNRLSINTNKTKHMLVESYAGNTDLILPKIKISDDALDNVTEYNYLGVLIDNTLTF